jgi:predicted transposase YbfD/YdcC
MVAVSRGRQPIKVPGCRFLVRVDRIVTRPDKSVESHDTRYFISSLEPARTKPRDLQKLIRGHWQVENCLHRMKDRYWEEDKHYLKHTGNLFVEMTSAALTQLQRFKQGKESIKAIAEDFHYAPEKLLHLLGFR